MNCLDCGEDEPDGDGFICEECLWDQLGDGDPNYEPLRKGNSDE